MTRSYPIDASSAMSFIKIRSHSRVLSLAGDHDACLRAAVNAGRVVFFL